MSAVLAAVTLLAAQVAATPAIPPGIRFKSAPSELNEKVRTLLTGAFGPSGKRFGDPSLYGKVVTCGPVLWKGIEATGAVTAPEKGRTVFVVAGPDGKPDAVAGRRFFAGELGEFQKAMGSIAPAGRYLVRAPSAAELQSYWGMISHDIVAPIFTVEDERHRFLLDFNGSDRAFMIEDLTAVTRGK